VLLQALSECAEVKIKDLLLSLRQPSKKHEQKKG
jgi:hypothetical protein